MTKNFEEEFDKQIETFNVIGYHRTVSCEIEQVKEVFKDWKPQQVLPVVKDFVAEWYEENKKDLEYNIYASNVDISKKDSDLNEFEEWLNSPTNKPIETLIRMKDGYTIEKPQLFLLKHIDMSNSNEDYDRYLFKDVYGRLQHDTYAKGKQPTDHTCKFTQKEIDTMNIGSYEQIEVKNEI